MPTSLKVMPLLVLSVLMITPRMSAQNAFYVNEDGQFRLVKEVRNGCPLIVVDGKLQMSSSPHFALIKAPFYLPGLVTLPQFVVINHHLHLGTRTSSTSLNYQIEVQGVAISAVPLKRCFFVLEIISGKDMGVLFAHLPDLEAGKEEAFDQYFRLQTPLEEGHYLMHFFSDGVELLHSRMPAPYLAAQKQKSDDFSSGRKTEFDAVPAHMIRAVYPAELTANALEGRVKVSCRIDPLGQVVSAEVVESNHPAFSEPALAAVRQWKFDPAVKDRHLVESTKIVSLSITPPEPKH